MSDRLASIAALPLWIRGALAILFAAVLIALAALASSGESTLWRDDND